MTVAVQFQNVSYRYPKANQNALSDVSFEITQGSFFALVGPNGAGKTTLLRLLCGRFLPTSGAVHFSKFFSSSVGALSSQKVGVLFEHPGVYATLSVKEYLDFFGRLYGVSDSYSRAKNLLSRLGFEESMNVRAGKLSLGNLQKLHIARAMLSLPKLLLLDEPAANLDPASRAALWDLLADFRRTEEGTLVVSSHILPELDSYASEFAILHHGKMELSQNILSNEKKKTPMSSLSVPFESEAEAIQILRRAGIDAHAHSESSPLEAAYQKVCGNLHSNS